MAEFTLYSTLGCHLCEQAKLIIDSVIGRYQLTYEECDIADSEYLLEAYGVLIPVFKHKDCEEYVNWPFDKKEVDEYIFSQSS